MTQFTMVVRGCQYSLPNLEDPILQPYKTCGLKTGFYILAAMHRMRANKQTKESS
jgi:hypothetical protein